MLLGGLFATNELENIIAADVMTCNTCTSSSIQVMQAQFFFNAYVNGIYSSCVFSPVSSGLVAQKVFQLTC